MPNSDDIQDTRQGSPLSIGADCERAITIFTQRLFTQKRILEDAGEIQLITAVDGKGVMRFKKTPHE